MFESVNVSLYGNQFSFLISTPREKHPINQSLERSSIVSALWPRMPTFSVKKGFPLYFTPDSSSLTRSFGERLGGLLSRTLWKLLSALQIEFERDSLETLKSTIEFLNCSTLDWLDFQYLLYHMKRCLYDTHFYLLNERYVMYLSNKLFIFTVNLLLFIFDRN